MKKFFLLPVILLLILNLPFIRVLSISNRKNFSERVYSRSAVQNGFIINYTHSVNKGRVHDFYHLTDDGQIELSMTEFVSYGAGIPEAYETSGAKFAVTDNGYIITDLHRKLPYLLMAVGVIAEHSVAFGKDSIESEEHFLKDFFKPQTSLQFEFRRVSFLSYLFTKKMS